jgi:LuxR family maltose regulon positive regulatory protein
MAHSGIRDWPGQSGRLDGPVSDLFAAKLRRPLPRTGTVRRSALITRLEKSTAPIVSVIAPAGYGKTTVLSQWADSSRHDVAWVSVDEPDMS